MFMEDPIAMVKVWEGGLVFYGGPLAALPVAIWYIKSIRSRSGERWTPSFRA